MPFGLKEKDYHLIKNVFQLFPKVEDVIIFGSRALGTEKPGSDIDLALKGNSIKLDDILSVKHKLEELPLIYEIDIINYHTIKTPELIEHIDKYGIVFYKKEKTPANWKTYKLGEIAEINPKIPLKQGNEYSFVEMKDLDAMLKYVVPSTKKELKGGSKFQNDDTLFARITPCLENGKICKVKNLENGVGFGSTEFLVFRGRENISNNDFIYYLSRTDYVRNNAVQMMSGSSGRQRVEKSALEELEVDVPDLPTQTKIAAILSSLDDKIELNQQMNQTLEAIAQAIFKEWFVNFKFPGFDGELVDGLPKGWENGKLGDILALQYGKALKADTRIVGDFPVVGSSGIVDSHNQYLVEGPGIVIGRKGTIGEVIWLDENFFPIDTTFYVKDLLGIEDLFFHFYLLVSQDFKRITSDSAVPGLNRNQALSVDVNIPSNKIIIAFNSVIKPFFEKKYSIIKENQTLTQLRDRLLPRLMTGKIEINV